MFRDDGSGFVYGQYTITDYMIDLLDDADAATARSSLDAQADLGMTDEGDYIAYGDIWIDSAGIGFAGEAGEGEPNTISLEEMIFNDGSGEEALELADRDNVRIGGFTLESTAGDANDIRSTTGAIAWGLTNPSGQRMVEVTSDGWLNLFHENGGSLYKGEEPAFTSRSAAHGILLEEGEFDGNWNFRDNVDIENSPVPAPQYPVFVLTVPYGAPWTDFELKASRTNFGEGGATPEMVYYYHSPGSTGSEIGDLPDVWFTDSQSPDRRQWIEQNNTPTRTSINAMLTNANSEVGGIVVVVTDVDVADAADDQDLVWSFSWLDGTTTDDDPGGNSIWRPIIPTTWVSETYQP